MQLYLDDDLADPLLARLLRQAGHDVRLPVEIGRRGSHDAVHLRWSIKESRVFLSGNHDDFEYLHELILEAQGNHAGILIVRRDNNPRRDLSAKGIVRAIRNLLATAAPLQDQFLVLNQYR